MTWKPKGDVEFEGDVDVAGMVNHPDATSGGITVNSSGNVGIGTSNPSWPLDVQATAATQGIKIRGRASDDISVFSFTNNANTVTQAALSCTSNYFSILVPAAERMRINNAGLITGTGTSLGAWTAYTPTLVGWTLGNGTVSGSYCQIGKVVHFQITLTVGSTTAIGSSPTFTVPVTMKSTTAWNVRGYFRDVSGGGTYDLAARPASTSTIGGFYIGTNGQHLSFNATTPFTWASGDVVALSGTYEAA